MRLWGLMRPMGRIFLSTNLVNVLACGYSSEIQRIFKKCVIWLHFPILELKKPDTHAKRSAVNLRY